MLDINKISDTIFFVWKNHYYFETQRDDQADLKF